MSGCGSYAIVAVMIGARGIRLPSYIASAEPRQRKRLLLDATAVSSKQPRACRETILYTIGGSTLLVDVEVSPLWRTRHLSGA